MVDPILRLRQVTKVYPGTVALKGVDLDVEAGGIHAIVGENGAGKSTLVKILSGAIRPTSGTITLRGVIHELARPADALRAGIATIYQDLTVVPQLSVAANVNLGREERIGRLPGTVSARRGVRSASLILDMLGARFSPTAKVGKLNYADRQLVDIAKAIARDCDVLVLDEPTASLSDEAADRLLTLLQKLKAEGRAIIYISHRLEEVLGIADRITVLRDGVHVATFPRAQASRDDVVRLMVGTVASVRHREHMRGNVVLEVERFGRKGRFHDINLRLHAGEVLGVAGVPGSGREDVLQAIVGDPPPDVGAMRVSGAPCRVDSPAQALRRGIVLLPGDRKGRGLALSQTVRRNIVLPPGGRASWRGLRNVPVERRTASDYIAAVGIRPADPDARTERLSGGNQQKVLFARTLYARPSVVLLDDPTTGVDVAGKVEIHNIIRSLAVDGVGVLLASSEMEELQKLCDRILVMCLGRIVGEFDARDADPEEILHLALPGANGRQEAS